LSEPSGRGGSGTAGAALRLGVVSYLNAAPLVYGLEGEPGFALIRDVPARIADRLHAGQLDLGMIPSIEYAFGEYAIVPGIAIASRGAVRSVSLYHRAPLERVSRIALDTSSRTSVALLKVLLQQRLGRQPECVEMAPDVPAMLEACEAALVIGDRALDFEGDLPRLDLGEEWRRQTGLPFVYAFWAGPAASLGAARVARLQEALRAGLSRLGEIAASYNGHDAGRRARNEAYLRSNIVFALGTEELAGLREFYRRAFALGLIPKAPELSFHGDP
jgi:chorismate dehydratase